MVHLIADIKIYLVRLANEKDLAGLFMNYDVPRD